MKPPSDSDITTTQSTGNDVRDPAVAEILTKLLLWHGDRYPTSRPA
ncbi:hypothetical protein CCP3SC15_100026 [Gammaproteobacteria bacterium]